MDGWKLSPDITLKGAVENGTLKFGKTEQGKAKGEAFKATKVAFSLPSLRADSRCTHLCRPKVSWLEPVTAAFAQAKVSETGRQRTPQTTGHDKEQKTTTQDTEKKGSKADGKNKDKRTKTDRDDGGTRRREPGATQKRDPNQKPNHTVHRIRWT